ncbi:MAG: hypothetical protein QM757_39550, partial [Paludibaculum sp.]
MIEDDDNDFWFGFEQEYFLWNPSTDKPLGFPGRRLPPPPGPLLLQRSALTTPMAANSLKNT